MNPRVLLPLLVVALVACSESSPPAVIDATTGIPVDAATDTLPTGRDVATGADASSTGCGVNTCARAGGANCGLISDGCLGTIHCGTCTVPGEFCGGGGPSRCGPGMLPMDAGVDACTPRACPATGACGSMSDGCGHRIQCGTCPTGQSCGVGGRPNVCGWVRGTTSAADAGTATCTPSTCAQLGVNCGTVDVGCGMTRDCGTCPMGSTCGGGGRANVCGNMVAAPPCTGLCLRRTACAGGGSTTLTGVVRSPAGVDPIYNAVVFIPNAPLEPFATRVACGCSADITGMPLVSATTDYQGRFTLSGVPDGANIPLVIQIGRWRRVVNIPMVNACRDNALPVELTRLPRRQDDGLTGTNIPRMAMVTGAYDALECVLRRIGLADSEFSANGGPGRVQMYRANGGRYQTSAADDNYAGLFASGDALRSHDIVLLDCEGNTRTRVPAHITALRDYAHAGGRVFATHFSFTWLPPSVLPGIDWHDVEHTTDYRETVANITTTFDRGMAFSQWLHFLDPSSVVGRIHIQNPRPVLTTVPSRMQLWIDAAPYDSGVASVGRLPNAPQHFTADLPLSAPGGDAACGRVVFSAFHVNEIDMLNYPVRTFPDYCATGPLSAEERALEFMLFDLSSCVGPPPVLPPPCPPTTCDQLRAQCGVVAGRCPGETLLCGTCDPGLSCENNQCVRGCTPRSCSDLGVTCGPAGNGCGQDLDCPPCPPGPRPMCTPTGCTHAPGECGYVADGCGGVVDCGGCVAPQTCGGGGTPNRCGNIG